MLNLAVHDATTPPPTSVVAPLRSVPPVGDLDDLTESYRRSLLSDVAQHRKVAKTVTQYMEAVTQFRDFLLANGMPTYVDSITRDHCEAWMAHLREIGRAPTTCLVRFRCLKAFFVWLVEDWEEIEVSPMDKMKAPSVPDTDVKVLSPGSIKAMIDAATSNEDRFIALRDNAILRLFSATGIRLDELVSLQFDPSADFNPRTTAHLDRDAGMIHVLGKGSGKGKRPRSINFDAETASHLDRYLNARRKRLAKRGVASSDLWLSSRGVRRLGPSGVSEIVRKAGELAGLSNVHPHQFRHSHADRSMRAGMPEGDIMRIHGWRSRAMLDRYGRSTQEERALDSHARYGIGAF